MKICIYGAGAIGGYVGAKLAAAETAGIEVTLIARGPHLAAMQADGLRLIEGGESRTVRVRCFADPAEAGPQDAVLMTLKAPAAARAAAAMRPLLKPETAVVTAQNGIPWWYFYGFKGALENHRLKSVDPDGAQWEGIGPERVIGCVVYPACEVIAPGVVRHIEHDRFILGEPSGPVRDRTRRFARALIAAGLKAPVRKLIRDEIWVKLWGNLAFNPISVLSHGTLEAMANNPTIRALARDIMIEASHIAECLGVHFSIDVDKRIAGTAAVGPHKTSMLQDFEKGRELETGAVIGAVREMADLVKVDCPRIDTVLRLLRARVAERDAGRD